MKFTVPGIAGQQINNAKLRLYNVNASNKGGAFYRVADSGWTESTVTWNNAPAPDATAIASLGAVSTNTWYEVDLTSLITGEGTFSLRMKSTSSDGADYNSKEASQDSLPNWWLRSSNSHRHSTYENLVARTHHFPDPMTRSTVMGHSRRLSQVAVIVFSLGLGVAEGRAAVLRVPQDYATIQAAINAAATGETVLVSQGTYAGGLVISGKTITLASEYINTGDANDVAQTIVTGGNPMIRIDATAVDTTVQGISFQTGGYGLVNYASRMNILDNRFINTGDAVSFETAGGVARGNYFDGASDDGIDVDHGDFDITIENNTILNSGNDGIEIRVHPYTGSMVNIVIRKNYISGSKEDGIQLIDYAGLSNRLFRIERNVIVNSAKVGIGCMADGNTTENFAGAPMVEEAQVVNNTFSGNPYGITGSDNMLVMNNIVANSTQIGLKRAAASSLASDNDFWNNGTNYTTSNVDTTTTIFQDPLFDANYNLQPGSVCIDAGATSVLWNGKTVNAPSYEGPGPDLGAKETLGGPVLPTVTVKASDASAAEQSADPGVFTVSRTGDTSAPLPVTYSIGGDATMGADYQTIDTSVTIPAGAASATVTIQPIDDSVVDDEEVLLTLGSGVFYVVGVPATATVTITDNDAA